MSVIELKSREQFNELINKTPYVAIQAQASWCGPCKAISPFFTKHADAHAIPDKYAFAKFDTDDVPDLAFELGIRSIPAFFFFKNGDKDNDLIGPIPPKLKVLVEGYSAEAKGEAPAAEKPAEKPAEPAAEKPAEEKPAEEKPAEKPAEEKPAEEKPAEKPAEEKPAEEKPAEEKKEENTLKTDENF